MLYFYYLLWFVCELLSYIGCSILLTRLRLNGRILFNCVFASDIKTLMQLSCRKFTVIGCIACLKLWFLVDCSGALATLLLCNCVSSFYCCFSAAPLLSSLLNWQSSYLATLKIASWLHLCLKYCLMKLLCNPALVGRHCFSAIVFKTYLCVLYHLK